jgi:hypothetical protein
MSCKRHRPPPPPEDDRKLWRAIAAAIAQGLSREALLIIVREVTRHF